MTDVVDNILKNSANITPAIVLGLSFNGLGIVRSLVGFNIPLIGIYTQDYEVGRHSKYCMAINFPILSSDPDNFKKKLIELGKILNRKSVLLPQNDEYVKFISDNRDELKHFFLFQVAPAKILDKLINKQEAESLAIENKLNVPKSFIPHNLNDLNFENGTLQFPLIIKPSDSFTKDFPGRRQVINSQSDLIDFYNNNPDFIGYTIVQEVVGEGDGNIFQCQTYLNSNSEPLAAISVRKVRQFPPNFGVGSYVTSEINNDLINLSLNFLKKIKYKGPASLEFIFLEVEKKYVFVELNPRYPGHIIFCTQDGVNLPYITYCDLTQNIYNEKLPIQLERKRFLWFECDIRAYFNYIKRGKAPNFFSWIKTYLTANSFLYFNRRDILPFLFQLLIYRRITTLMHKVKILFKK